MAEPVVTGQYCDPAEEELWRLWRDENSAGARERIFTMYAPFAQRIARAAFLGSSSGDVDLGDLKQWACAGLLEAIDRFDPGRGAPFRAFARRRIRGSVLDGLSKASERLEQVTTRARLRKERLQALTQGSGTEVSGESLERLVDLAIGLALGFMLEGARLYVDGEPRDETPNAYQSLAWKETLVRLEREVARLTDPGRAVIRHHYGGDLDLAEIATLLGLTKGRVSQIHRAALTDLRRRLGRTFTSVQEY